MACALDTTSSRPAARSDRVGSRAEGCVSQQPRPRLSGRRIAAVPVWLVATWAWLLLADAACSTPRTRAEASGPSAQPTASQVEQATPKEAPDRAAAKPQAQDEAAAPAEPNSGAASSAPDASGWGTAAGLRYLEIVRGDAAPEEALPLIIVIHGLGDRPHRGWLQAVDIEPDLKARMIFPQAPTPYGRGFAWFEYRFRDRNEAALADGIRAAQARVFSLIERVRATRPTRGRVIVCGFSQGGMLSFALALAHPEPIQIAVPISGELPPPLWPQAKFRGGWFPEIVALHGTADRVVALEADDKLVRHLEGLGYPAKLLRFEGAHHHVTPSMSQHVRSTLSAAVRQLWSAP